MLDELGVDLFQGFYFGKPQPMPIDRVPQRSAA